MLSPEQFHNMVPQIEAHSRRSMAADDRLSVDPFFGDHTQHGENPVYRAAGWQNHDCGYTTCDHYNEEIYDWNGAMDRAHNDPTPRRARLDTHTAPLRANESVVDVAHVVTLHAFGNQISRANRPPRLLEHESGLHILDGHHRLLAAHLRGEAIPVEISRGR